MVRGVWERGAEKKEENERASGWVRRSGLSVQNGRSGEGGRVAMYCGAD